MKDEPPRTAILVGAFMAAAAAAPIPAGLIMTWDTPGAGLDLLLIAMVFGFPLALLTAVLLALPAYLLVRSRWHISWWNSALCGGLIGMLPAAFLSPDLGSLLSTAPCGLLGGFVFWLVLRPKRRLEESHEFRQTFG